MLIHACGAPVEVVEEARTYDEDHRDEFYSTLKFFCQVCNEVVFDDQELFVVDSLTLLEEAVK